MEIKYGNHDYPIVRERLVEVSVFLFLIAPSSALSFFVFDQGQMNFVVLAAATILRDLSLLALVLFFLWRNGEVLSEIGLTTRSWLREAGVGLALFIPFFFSVGLLESLFRALGLNGPSSSAVEASMIPKGTWEYIMAVILIGVVALTEETLFRGYLTVRFKTVTGQWVAAVILSSAVFAFGHGYEGSAGVATVGIIGLIFAIIFIWRKSLVAPIVMHFLLDFIAIVLVPLLQHYNLSHK